MFSFCDSAQTIRQRIVGILTGACDGVAMNTQITNRWFNNRDKCKDANVMMALGNYKDATNTFRDCYMVYCSKNRLSKKPITMVYCATCAAGVYTDDSFIRYPGQIEDFFPPDPVPIKSKIQNVASACYNGLCGAYNYVSGLIGTATENAIVRVSDWVMPDFDVGEDFLLEELDKSINALYN